ncbi:tyrosinase-like protein [Parathielavia appendiculata]|uniref:Tyrosinase-like protein n=1 Tax=Parathielavia appendiculata TaxID=2587402 RepID=A0AAN6TWV6_9PEZI|nr:tyrosinase-like protein [Parathielavia appendiculata]
MRLSASITLAAAIKASAIFSIPSFEQFAIDSGLALSGLNGIALLNSATKYGGSCNVGNVKIRREWRTLPKAQRKSYIQAVQCVQNTPSILNPGVPGSKSLFDDFVFVHLLQTTTIHFTGNFLIWHRWYIHQYELKLNACGYNGALPYWDWGFDVDNPRASPVFDGSDTSMGSDGEFVPGGPLEILIPGTAEPIVLAKGTGGGCVFSGPFKNMTVHLGPITQPDPTQDNPRCLKRDLNADAGKRFASFRNTTDLIVNSPNIEIFRTTMEADPGYIPNSLGVHGGGHFIISGDPGSDAFISPGDPAFYLHHAQIDRVYWIWQMLDLENRQGVFGTNTLLNMPPSANTTVEDLIDLSPIAGPVKIKTLMNTVGGTPLCYVYL